MHDLSTLVCWDGRAGTARFGGVTVVLEAAPPICQHVAEVDYVPALRRSHVRQSAGDWRPMRRVERDTLDAMLDSMAKNARSAVLGLS